MKHLGARRSTPNWKKAERFFPVRLRIVVPPFGFGMKYAEMGYWLDRHVGKRDYFISGGSGYGDTDRPYEQFSRFHFLDMAAAQAFVDHFKNEVRLAVGLDRERPD